MSSPRGRPVRRSNTSAAVLSPYGSSGSKFWPGAPAATARAPAPRAAYPSPGLVRWRTDRVARSASADSANRRSRLGRPGAPDVGPGDRGDRDDEDPVDRAGPRSAAADRAGAAGPRAAAPRPTAAPTAVTVSASTATRAPARRKVRIWSGSCHPRPLAPGHSGPGVERQRCGVNSRMRGTMEPRLPKARRWPSISRSTKQALALPRRWTRRATGSASRADVRLARRGRRRRGALFAVLLLLTVGLRLPAFFVEVFNSDETFLATQAEVINEGGRLYEDATDRKPPLVPYLYAATFSVLGTERALVRARRRDARGRAHRAAARARGPAPVRRARRVGRRAALRLRVGRVRAAGRAGRELRGLHAAGDDRGGPARRARATRDPPESRWRWRRSRSRPARPRCSRCSTSSGGRAGSAGSTDAAIGFSIPIAIVALLVGPGELLFWTLLGNGSYFGLGSASAYVLGPVRRDDARVRRVATCRSSGRCRGPGATASSRSRRRADGGESYRSVRRARHRPLDLAGVGRAVGRGRVPVLRPLLPAAAAAAVPAERGRAHRRAAAAGEGDGRVRRSSSRSASRCSASG